MHCGQCQINFKSYLRLQAHMAEVHGHKNRAAKWNEYSQKEGLNAAEERLKQAISDYQHNN